MDEVIEAKPRKIFLLIGINDLSRGLPIPVILRNYRMIVDRIRKETPHTKLYIESVMPLNEAITKPDYLKNKKDSILNLNKGIKEIADQYNVPYINLHEIFADEKGDLKAALTADGIHPRPAAYVIWIDYLKKKKYL
jgi:lysophospholipase L1-like esterase